MSTTTPNLNLIKPAGTDFVNVADLNSNFDIIDTKFGDFTGTVKDIKDSVPQVITKKLSVTVPASSYKDQYFAFDVPQGMKLIGIVGIVPDLGESLINVTINSIYAKDSTTGRVLLKNLSGTARSDDWTMYGLIGKA